MYAREKKVVRYVRYVIARVLDATRFEFSKIEKLKICNENYIQVGFSDSVLGFFLNP